MCDRSVGLEKPNLEQMSSSVSPVTNMSATSASRLVKLSASEKSVNRDEVPPSVRVLARISALTKAPLESVARGVSMNWYQDSGVSTTRPTI